MFSSVAARMLTTPPVLRASMEKPTVQSTILVGRAERNVNAEILMIPGKNSGRLRILSSSTSTQYTPMPVNQMQTGV